MEKRFRIKRIIQFLIIAILCFLAPLATKAENRKQTDHTETQIIQSESEMSDAENLAELQDNTRDLLAPIKLGKSDAPAPIGQTQTGIYGIRNALTIDRYPNTTINNFTVTVTGAGAGSTTSTIQPNAVAGTGGPGTYFLDGQYTSKLYTSWVGDPLHKQKYGAKNLLLKNRTGKETVVATYPDAGSYRTIDGTGNVVSRRLDIQITFSNLKYSKHGSAQANTIYLGISQNPWLGYIFLNMTDFTVTYQYKDAQTKQLINFNKNDAFMTFSSLNGGATNGEYVQYKNTGNYQTYTTSDTNVVLKKPINGTFNPGQGAIGANSVFEDNYTKPTFSRNSISVILGGSTHSFNVGNWGLFSAWIAPNTTSLYRAKPDVPRKDVTKKNSTVSVDGQQVKAGETLVYKVYQKSSTLYEFIQSPWTSFTIQDVLPAGVTYQSAKLLSPAGVDITAANGVVGYAAATRAVSFTANSTFLTKTNKYAGEEYCLAIEVKVNSPVTAPLTIKNTASTKIELLTQNTNTVTNNVPITQGAIQITKKDDAGKVLAGATYVIKNSAGTQVATGVTNASGLYTVTNLPIGNYTVTETGAPAGHVLLGGTAASQVKAVTDGGTTAFTFVNDRQGKVVITKRDKESNALLQGASYQVKSGANVVATLTTGANGTITSGFLTAGTYTVTETAAPTNYALDSVVANRTQNLTITKGGTAQLTFLNLRQKGSLEVIKKDDAGKVLAGATYVVKNSTGAQVATGTTNASGSYSVPNLPTGTYAVTETAAPAGHVLLTGAAATKSA